MSSTGFKALKVSSGNNSGTASSVSAASETGGDAPKATARVEDISSPHELTAFVESILGQLETKFDEMSTQILERMSQMSARVDSLETSIQDLISADFNAPQSPGLVASGMARKGSAG